ncbi:MAG: sulfotransferase domain-containing protein, partial [Paramuribaculum sp.]|nr:sulfotransferase domain-containing protein [Paramuribaculum sp.]
STYFPMKPEMKEETFAEIKKIIEAVGKKVEKEEFDKIVEYLTKTFTEAKEKNSPWLSAIASWVRSGEDTFNNNLEVLRSLSPKDVEKFVKDLLKQGNYRVVVLDPAE